MKNIAVSLFLLFSNITIQADGIVKCIQENREMQDFGTVTGLVLSEQSWWYKFQTFLSSAEDVPIQLISVSKFYKNKGKEEKKAVLQTVKDDCSRIGGKIITESIHDFTQGPIAFGGICIRDKILLKEKNVKYLIVHSTGYASSGSMKQALASKASNQCTQEHQGQIIGKMSKVTRYLDNFYSYAGICLSLIHI